MSPELLHGIWAILLLCALFMEWNSIVIVTTAVREGDKVVADRYRRDEMWLDTKAHLWPRLNADERLPKDTPQKTGAHEVHLARGCPVRAKS